MFNTGCEWYCRSRWARVFTIMSSLKLWWINCTLTWRWFVRFSRKIWKRRYAQSLFHTIFLGNLIPSYSIVANCGMMKNSHLPYSSNFSPADFFLYFKVKAGLKRRRLQDGKVLKKKITAGLIAVSLDAFSDCFVWKMSVAVKGDYFEEKYSVLFISYVFVIMNPVSELHYLTLWTLKMMSIYASKHICWQEWHNLY